MEQLIQELVPGHTATQIAPRPFSKSESKGTLPNRTTMKMVVINEMTEFWDESKLVVADLADGKLLERQLYATAVMTIAIGKAMQAR